MFDRQKLAGTIKEAADKAGTLVMTALAIACAALLLAGFALVVAMKVRSA